MLPKFISPRCSLPVSLTFCRSRSDPGWKCFTRASRSFPGGSWGAGASSLLPWQRSPSSALPHRLRSLEGRCSPVSAVVPHPPDPSHGQGVRLAAQQPFAPEALWEGKAFHQDLPWVTSQADQSCQRPAGRGRLDGIAWTTASSRLPPQRAARRSQINDSVHEKINKQSREPASSLPSRLGASPRREIPPAGVQCGSSLLAASTPEARARRALTHGLTPAAPDPAGTAAGSSRPVLSLRGRCHSRRGHPGGHRGASPSGPGIPGRAVSGPGTPGRAVSVPIRDGGPRGGERRGTTHPRPG